MRPRTLAPAFLIATLLAPPMRAQDTAHHGCFRGRPAAQCAWFPLIEVGYSHRFTDHQQDDELNMFTWTLGGMANTGPRTALGGGLVASIEGDARLAAMVRYRRWLSENASLDAGAGVHVAGNVLNTGVRTGSPFIQARLNAGDRIALTARYDRLYLQPTPCYDPVVGPYRCPARVSNRVYGGVELGSTAGAVGYAVSAVLFVLALITVANDFS